MGLQYSRMGPEGSGVGGNNRGREGNTLTQTFDTWKAKVVFAVVVASQVAEQPCVVERPPQQEGAQKPGSLCRERWEERDCALTKPLTTRVSTGRYPVQEKTSLWLKEQDRRCREKSHLQLTEPGSFYTFSIHSCEGILGVPKAAPPMPSSLTQLRKLPRQ